MMQYFNNQIIFAEREVTRLQSVLRYRAIDIVDCMEMAVALADREALKRVSRDIRHIIWFYSELDD